MKKVKLAFGNGVEDEQKRQIMFVARDLRKAIKFVEQDADAVLYDLYERCEELPDSGSDEWGAAEFDFHISVKLKAGRYDLRFAQSEAQEDSIGATRFYAWDDLLSHVVTVVNRIEREAKRPGDRGVVGHVVSSLPAKEWTPTDPDEDDDEVPF